MAEITNRVELKAWLGNKDRAVAAAIAIAARAALRVAPMIAMYLRMSPTDRSAAIALPFFRAATVPWFIGHRPNHGTVVAAASTAYAAAAASADAAVDSASAAILWSEVTLDVNALEAGCSPEDVLKDPLWRGAPPKEVEENWRALKADLLALQEDWEVWTDWYEDRLHGAADPASRELIEQLELKRVQIPDKDWEKGPKHVNAMITALEAEYRAQAPVQRPAIIEVEIGEDAVLHRRPPRPPEARDDTQEQRLRDAWAAHAAQLSALEALNPGQNARALAGAMKLYREALGTAYEEMNVIALGVHGDSLQAHAERADDRLLEDAAGALVGMAASHGLFIRQFDAWLDYVADAAGEPSDDAVESAVEVARATRDVIDLIGGDVSEPLNELADMAQPPLTADPADRPPRAVQNEFLGSTGNVLSGLFTPFVGYAREAGGKARKGSLDGVEEGSKTLAKNLIEKAPRVIAFGTLALGLAAAMPGEFGWLVAVVALLKMKLK